MRAKLSQWLEDQEAIREDMYFYDEENYSLLYKLPKARLIIDCFHFDTQLLDVFDYRTYTSFQNRIMQKGLPVYRFLIEENPTEVEAWLTGSVEFSNTYTFNRDRSLSVADASSLEHFFEQRFCEVYGCDAIKYLHREFPLPSRTKTSYSLDYVVQKLNGTMVAVEENGVSYHHPLLIGRTAYKRQIEKQNICSFLGIPLYRFTSLDCAYPALVDEQIRYIFGDSSTFRLAGLSLQRSYRLYDHQILALEEIQKIRSTSPSPHAVLQVFPTATGKSKIVEEDLIGYLSKHAEANVLIVGPSLRIVEDWKQRMSQLCINTSITIGTDIGSQIVIGTYHLLWSLANKVESSYFSYVVFDEAHHAVAPVIRRNLQFFEPDFLIGLTATPERLDEKRLEEVFGTYRSKLDLQQAIEKQLIANIRAYRIETNLSLAQVRFNGKDFVNADLERAIHVDSRNRLVAEILKRYFDDGKKGIIFCINVRHAQEMAQLLQDVGLKAEAVSGKTRNMKEIVESFRFKSLQFLCSCDLLNEGWDVPEIEVLVMARPTISKVLYLQQLGRGLRKSKTKRELFVIDVVDQYGSIARPWSVHALFNASSYVPFGLIHRQYEVGDIVSVLGLQETVRALVPVNITTFERSYKGYLDEEQAARELYIGTSTLHAWVLNKSVSSDLVLPFGARKIHYFKPETIEEIRHLKKLGVHNNETLYDDFFAFIEEKNYTFSFKMVFLMSLIEHCDKQGEANIERVLKSYRSFYKKRLENNLAVDRPSCIYTDSFLDDLPALKRNMLANPFEKFERKRFIQYVKDLDMLGFNPLLYSRLSKDDLAKVVATMKQHLKEYYSELGGLLDD